MKKNGFYSSGEFAKMARVTVRTVRYYDKQNKLKPSFVDEHGSRYYTDADFALLQQILLLKYLGFSLDDIKAPTIQINQQVNVDNVNNFNAESRKRILSAVNSIMNGDTEELKILQGNIIQGDDEEDE